MSGILQAVAAFKSNSSGITYVATGTAGTGVNPTPGLPAGWATGDLLVMCGTSGSSWTDPAGWTIALNSATNPRPAMWYKIAAGGESAPTLTNANSASIAAIAAFRGVNATPLDVLGTNNATATTTSLTTTVANDLVVSMWGSNTNADDPTAPGGVTSIFDSAGTAGVRGLMMAYELQAAAGATTTRTVTWVTSTTISSFAASFKPA